MVLGRGIAACLAVGILAAAPTAPSAPAPAGPVGHERPEALRLLPPGAPVPGAEPPGPGFRFAKVIAGAEDPVRWDPCGPAIRVSLTGARWGGGDGRALSYALAQVQTATGLRFQRGRARPQARGAARVAGHRAGQITVAVRSGSVSSSGAVALGTWYATGSGGFERLTAGLVEVDGTVTRSAPAWVRAMVYMHELGHVVGLSHVADPAQIMYPSLPPRTQWNSRSALPIWGAGDRAGLRALGADGGCAAAAALSVLRLRLRTIAAGDRGGAISAAWPPVPGARGYLVRRAGAGSRGHWRRVDRPRHLFRAVPPGRHVVQVRVVGRRGPGPAVAAAVRL